eukprot:4056762-Prymnesium_polylepis.1
MRATHARTPQHALHTRTRRTRTCATRARPPHAPHAPHTRVRRHTRTRAARARRRAPQVLVIKPPLCFSKADAACLVRALEAELKALGGVDMATVTHTPT